MEKRVLIAREPAKAARLIEKLRQRGIEGIALSPTRIEVNNSDALAFLSLDYDWIAFTSATAVEVFHDLLQARSISIPATPKLAATAKTSAAKIERLFGRVDFIGKGSDGAAFGRELSKQMSPESNVLWPSALITAGGFWRELEAAGIAVTQLPIYRTIPVRPALLCSKLKKFASFDAILYFAPSGVNAMIAAEPSLRYIPALAIGQTTARALKELDVETCSIAEKPDQDSILKTLFDLLPL